MNHDTIRFCQACLKSKPYNNEWLVKRIKTSPKSRKPYYIREVCPECHKRILEREKDV